MGETVLIFGAGGREHALAYRFSQNDPSRCRKLWVCPGNAGIAESFDCVALPEPSIASYVNIAKRLRPDLIVIGPEDPLAFGLVDALAKEGFATFGPSQACARLEASKSFMKEICAQAQIKTAASTVLKSASEAEHFFFGKSGAFVVKADGLCAGKGVSICQDVAQALEVAKTYLGDKGPPLFGQHSQTIIIEEFLPGQEVSVIGMCDGEDALLFSPVRDHKRLLDGDKGPNTGGMGVIGPLFSIDEQNRFLGRVKEEVFLPALRTMKKRGTPFRGFLYAGLMMSQSNLHLLEFNVRLGDPEAQALLFGTDLDLFAICYTLARGGRLKELGDLSLAMQPTAVVVMATGGYPQTPAQEYRIDGLDLFRRNENTCLFFAGVKKNSDGQFVTSSGRVLSCASRAASLAEALANCYHALSLISFSGAQYRRDIGHSYGVTHAFL